MDPPTKTKRAQLQSTNKKLKLDRAPRKIKTLFDKPPPFKCKNIVDLFQTVYASRASAEVTPSAVPKRKAADRLPLLPALIQMTAKHMKREPIKLLPMFMPEDEEPDFVADTEMDMEVASEKYVVSFDPTGNKNPPKKKAVRSY